MAAAGRLPTLVACSANGRAVGFATLERDTPVAAEVHVMGVSRAGHGRDHGRRLLGEAERHLMAAGVRWLTVKTLAASHPDPHYARTRAFYEAVGTDPLEVFPTLWGEDAPCLLMVKPLAASGRA
ncbi:GNAT family N-acetyltransferase [Sphingomonas sp.]|uniref:GNAT family N-acetyltransferase n=1 Tax=Sphingomonas sp. TaxID=28214 RepID=UPI003B0044C7